MNLSNSALLNDHYLYDRYSTFNLPHQEYPRPEFVRLNSGNPHDDVLNLNGPWHLHVLKAADGMPTARQIIAPYAPESPASGLDFGSEYHLRKVLYSRTFRIPNHWQRERFGSRFILRIENVDYHCQVNLNGHDIGSDSGWGVPFAFEASQYLVSGENTLVIDITDDNTSGCDISSSEKAENWTPGLQASGKQCKTAPSGCHYHQVIGLLGTVWIERVPSTYLEHVYIATDTQGLSLQPVINGRSRGYTVQVKVLGEKEVIRKVTIPASQARCCIRLASGDTKLWKPGHPFLYGLEFTLEYGGAVVDRVRSYCGLRSIETHGSQILLNHEPLVMRLVLNQGYTPSSFFTPLNMAQAFEEISIAEAMGFNGSRLHQQVFNRYYHYYADMLGHILWVDANDWGVDIKNPRAIKPFTRLVRRILRRDSNHPSMLVFCPLNEQGDSQNEGRGFTKAVAKESLKFRAKHQSNFLYVDSSGWNHGEDGEIFDIHRYVSARKLARMLRTPKALRYHFEHQYMPGGLAAGGKPIVVSEYGGLAWNSQCNPGSQNYSTEWGYDCGKPRSASDVVKLIQRMSWAIDNSGSAGRCYTQLKNTRPEINGLLDENGNPKFPIGAIRRANVTEVTL